MALANGWAQHVSFPTGKESRDQDHGPCQQELNWNICLTKVATTLSTSSEAPRSAVHYFSRLKLGSAIIILPPQPIRGGVNSQSVSHIRAPRTGATVSRMP